MSPYIPTLGIMLLALGFLGVSVVLSLLVGPRRYNRVKYDTYECGKFLCLWPTVYPPSVVIPDIFY